MTSQATQLIKLIFRVACVTLALYMTILEAMRFQQNEDVSSITFKKLNQNPKDQYPTITFCLRTVELKKLKYAFEGSGFFEDCYSGIYDKRMLNKELNITHNQEHQDCTCFAIVQSYVSQLHICGGHRRLGSWWNAEDKHH